ncbi:MAG TPA: branched-chain amino acid ABC transporter permease [Gaiellales bacterium]|jgi:branched-chain amino acid transport system permease protein
MPTTADLRSALTAQGVLARSAAIVAFLGISLFLFPAVLGADWIKTLTSVAIYAVVAAGLVTLYGRVGMISLGQIALLAIGTWTATRINYAIDLPFPVLLLVTGAITCAVGVLIGLPALRLSGLYLALITLMAAGAVNVVLTTINFPNGGKGFTGRTAVPDLAGLQPVGRPGIAGGDTAYYRYTIVICALMFMLIAWHFATKPGRAWASIRESEPAALAAGVNIVKYKLWAFALASFTTGVAGALLAAQLGQPTPFGFPTQDSLTLLAAALIGGIYSLWGAVIAGAFSQLAPFIFQAEWGVDPNFLLIIFGVGLLQVLLTAPRGIVVQMPKDIATLGRLGLRAYRSLTGSRGET